MDLSPCVILLIQGNSVPSIIHYPLSQLTWGMSQGTLWTGHLKFRNKQPHAQIHTYGQFRVSSPDLHVCGLSGEVRVPGGDLRRHRENMQTQHRKALTLVTVLTAALPCQPKHRETLKLSKISHFWHNSEKAALNKYN